jgi:hypothetical protein
MTDPGLRELLTFGPLSAIIFAVALKQPRFKEA